jgi:hypothetical protein
MTDTLTLNAAEILFMLGNMDEGNVRTIAVQAGPHEIEFRDESGRLFDTDTVSRIYEIARAREFYCYSCERRKLISEWDRDSNGVDLCMVCYEEAGLENEHQDGHHTELVPGCPMCTAERA